MKSCFGLSHVWWEMWSVHGSIRSKSKITCIFHTSQVPTPFLVSITSYWMGSSGTFPRSTAARGVKLNTHIYLVPRLKWAELYFQFPHTPSWCATGTTLLFFVITVCIPYNHLFNLISYDEKSNLKVASRWFWPIWPFIQYSALGEWILICLQDLDIQWELFISFSRVAVRSKFSTLFFILPN